MDSNIFRNKFYEILRLYAKKVGKEVSSLDIILFDKNSGGDYETYLKALMRFIERPFTDYPNLPTAIDLNAIRSDLWRADEYRKKEEREIKQIENSFIQSKRIEHGEK